MIAEEKLVRDRIPEIIRKSGREPETRIASGEELFTFLERKLDEETAEFHVDKNLEELADVLEVIIGLANHLGYTEKELFEMRNKKKDERGGFNQGVLLKIKQ